MIGRPDPRTLLNVGCKSLILGLAKCIICRNGWSTTLLQRLPVIALLATPLRAVQCVRPPGIKGLIADRADTRPLRDIRLLPAPVLQGVMRQRRRTVAYAFRCDLLVLHFIHPAPEPNLFNALLVLLIQSVTVNAVDFQIC